MIFVLFTLLCVIYSLNKWLYTITYRVYFMQANRLFFGTWNELIFLTLFVMEKYDSVFEQIGF